MTPGKFLLEELDNVRELLAEALRHDYRHDGKGVEPFYSELQLRLDNLRKLIEEAVDDVDQLGKKSKLVSEVSYCISLIERSHLGEFSWAFGEKLIKLGECLCQEGSLAKMAAPAAAANRTAIFHISADGGLSSYKIQVDTELLIQCARRRIFNVVFPRTLKPHVLLHAVLAHELCHAALSISGHGLVGVRRILKDGRLDNDKDALSWLAQVNPECAGLHPGARSSFVDEFLCDLTGLLLFGPSFVHALSALLGAIDPAGRGTEDSASTHPPALCRIDVLLQAIRLLEWNTKLALPVDAPAQCPDLYKRYWDDLKKRAAHAPPDSQSPFTDQQLGDALAAIRAALQGCEVAEFEKIDRTSLPLLIENLLLGVPPIASRVTAKGEMDLSESDFRLIVWAGWIVWTQKIAHDPPPEKQAPDAGTGTAVEVNVEEAISPFTQVNILCERGILHAIAVETAMSTQDKNERPIKK